MPVGQKETLERITGNSNSKLHKIVAKMYTFKSGTGVTV